VSIVPRHAALRIVNQGLQRLGVTKAAFSSRASSIASLSALSLLSPQVLKEVDAWLWPHCFSPVPNLRFTVPICNDLIHRHYPSYFTRWALARRAAGERSLANCRVILCLSQCTERDLLDAWPFLAGRTRVFTPAPCERVDLTESSDAVRRVRDQYSGEAIFLYVAVDHPHKNHELLVRAAAKARGMTNRSFKVLFVGRRRSTTLRRMIASHGVQDVGVDVGSVSRDELAALYTVATAFLFPSFYEGFGIPLVEAMSYGVPIIASA